MVRSSECGKDRLRKVHTLTVVKISSADAGGRHFDLDLVALELWLLGLGFLDPIFGAFIDCEGRHFVGLTV